MIRVHQTAQGYEAEAVIDTRFGPVVARASAPTGWVDEACARLLEQRPELLVSGADFFADLKKTFGDVAKSKAFADVTSIVSQVASSPLAQAAVSAVGSPAAGAALGGVGMAAAAANTMAAKARAGDPRAVREVAEVAGRAKRGDPKAQKAARLLRESFAAQAAKDTAAPLVPMVLPTVQAQQAPQHAPLAPMWLPTVYAPQAAQAPQAFAPTMAQPGPTEGFGFPYGTLVDWAAYRGAVDGRPFGAPG